MPDNTSLSPVVEQIRNTVEARLRELQPVAEEIEQLESILATLNSGEAGRALPQMAALLESATAPIPAEPLKPAVRYGRRGTKPGRDGRAPQGHNKQQIIKTILERPGITAPEIAELTGVKRTVVSATINRLKRGGELEPYGEGVRVPLVADLAGALAATARSRREPVR